MTPRVSDGSHPIKVQFFVENIGSRYGAEVPQVYLGLPPPSANRRSGSSASRR